MSMLELNSDIVLDPRQALLYGGDRLKYNIKKSCSQITPREIPTDSLSSASASWGASILPPSRNSIVSRDWYIRCVANVDLAGVAAAGNLVKYTATGASSGDQSILDGNSMGFGLRFCPLAACTSQTNLTINEVGVQQSTNIFSPQYQFTFNDDMVNVYDQVSAPDSFPLISQYANNNNNPLSPYGTTRLQQTRSDVKWTVLSNTGTTASLQVEWLEPVNVPGLLERNVTGVAHAGFINVSNMSLVLVFQNLSNMFEIAIINSNYTTPLTITSVSFDSMFLNLSYLTPAIALPPIRLPQYYNYEQYNFLLKDVGQIAYGSTFDASSNGYNLSTIPSKIICYVGKDVGTKSLNSPLEPNYYYTDTTCAIERVNLQWMNIGNVLGTASEYELYRISQRNGLRASYEQWRKFGSSVLILNPGVDLPSSPLGSVASSELTNLVVG